jgi:PAS domain-containing protein
VTFDEIAELNQGKISTYFENRYRCNDGTYKWFAWSAKPFGSRLFAVARDITDRKRYQVELEASESRFRKLFEESPFSIQMFSPDGQTIKVNRKEFQRRL